VANSTFPPPQSLHSAFYETVMTYRLVIYLPRYELFRSSLLTFVVLYHYAQGINQWSLQVVGKHNRLVREGQRNQDAVYGQASDSRVYGQALESMVRLQSLWPGSRFYGQDLESMVRLLSLWSGSRVYGQDLEPMVRLQSLWSGSRAYGQALESMVRLWACEEISMAPKNRSRRNQLIQVLS